MYPYIHFVLPSYGVFAFLGGFFALLLVYFRTNRFNVEFEDFLKLFVLCIAGGMIGSKTMFIITRIPWLLQNFTLRNLVDLIFRSGYVFYGGLFGVLLTVVAYAKHSKKYTARCLDALIAPAIPLFHCFGRIGCLLAGCCFGCELPQSIIVMGISITRFPTQILESTFEAMLFVILMIWEKRCKKVTMLQFYLTAYACFRFVIEFFRDDKIRGVFFGFSTAQWISIMILLYYASKICRRYAVYTSKHTIPNS